VSKQKSRHARENDGEKRIAYHGGKHGVSSYRNACGAQTASNNMAPLLAAASTQQRQHRIFCARVNIIGIL